jgi:putrescine aminotransferase
LLDAFAGLWCVNVGYGRKSIADVAYKQLLELPYYNTFFKTTHPPVAELSKLLVDITPKQFTNVFYGQAGSDANDTIIRMVRSYWNLKKQPKKKTVLSRVNSYHGSTMVASSLSGMSYMHELADLPLPGFDYVPQPYCMAKAATRRRRNSANPAPRRWRTRS